MDYFYQKDQETKTGQSSNQLVVPKGLQQQLMPVNDESALSGHLGARTTLDSDVPVKKGNGPIDPLVKQDIDIS